MKQLNELQPVYDSLGNWWGQIHFRNDQGLYDINRESEDVAAGLLNLVFNLDLKNLNEEEPNFPGIDLGDDKNKKAFQVTSRTDPAKIKKDMGTFMKMYQGRFPGGIRFLILSAKKPRISKEECKDICPGFDPKVDILNLRDIQNEIKKIYREDNRRFQRIRDFLLEELGPGRPKKVDTLKILGEGSKKYYRSLRGPNGRFRFLRIADIILPQTQTPDQVQQTMKTPEPGGEPGVPSLVLLLDGFNEITVEKRELLLELNHLTEQFVIEFYGSTL